MDSEYLQVRYSDKPSSTSSSNIEIIERSEIDSKEMTGNKF